ncbi:McrB family protein [Staphylococcus sp. HMSC061G12]|uniref:McrB family protein n=1 Tax=Staphylococcus sp. HMSC061G12 TaxID=1739441 RepID=UPI0008AA367F|nr:AAA family ATPase [Staphylococcus sp. HMSC061G12]OHR52832.1 hypothetical protein HMPREF2937_11900 [Staphylococcus sp. HMSC061G12]
MKNNWENVDLIGVIATPEEVSSVYGKENIFINNNNYIQFYVKVISTTPYDYPVQNNKSKYISCFSSHLKNIYTDDLSESNEKRIRDFDEYIQDKFICFNVEERHEDNYLKRTYYNGRVNEILIQPNDLKDVQGLHPVPVYSKENTGQDFEGFIKKIKNKEYVGNIYNISKEVEDAPQLIFYKDENYNIYVIGDLNGFKYQGSKGFAYDFSEEIKYVNLNENDYKKLCLTKDNIAYISTELSRNIEEKLNFEKKNKIEVNKEDDLKAVKKEEEFLNHFIETLKRNRLVYDEEDILNFHTAMKTSNLVILSGMSGTGKSKLVKAYADALSLKDSFKFIPVSPSWTEDSDIIGYADTLNMVYRPDDYGLIDLLINAKENPDKLFIVCFDEMNLARIEHYFSQFLSLLETDVESRRLSLYNRELGGKLYNSSKYSYQIPIGRNVKFVGTANIDDSTYNFSNKVLDRSNLITLKVMPFKDLVKLSKRDNTTNFNDEEFDKIYVDYFSNSKKEIELDERTVEFLQKFHDLLSQVHNEMGIGPRILKQIDLYLKNIPVNSISFTKKEGLDLQVVQRILTKVRGSSEELEKLLGIYDSDGTVISSEILSLFEEFEDVSNFTNSEKVIKQKAKELNLNGYTF